ncbi:MULTISPECIES: hypothetical protein [unclassified Arthrobacter]|uniref:hypothetical protein n=1 Tax=unclassified Arthrobacter TaxID=235627 RepID=UPI0006F5FDE8|nr:hypothetical protein [Arthrobacter sp. Leaf234]KQO03873.1 hypothetical protein ASF21_06525 [Arthrobacter sp. Leaf234]
MAGFPYAEEQRASINAAIVEAGFSTGEVWLRYFSLSGEVEEYEVEAYLAGLIPLPPLECDLLALAVNEMVDDLPPRRRARFCDDLVRAHSASEDDTEQ